MQPHGSNLVLTLEQTNKQTATVTIKNSNRFSGRAPTDLEGGEFLKPKKAGAKPAKVQIALR